MEARESYYRGRHRTASQWPPAETEYRTLYLRAPAGAGAAGTLEAGPGGTEEQVSYDSLGSGLAPRRAEFEITFAAPAELIGHTTATLYLSSPDAEDLDVFVALFKLDAGGAPVGFPYYAQFEDGPAAVGWQRASHRELDPARSTPYLPVLAHQRALPVPAGEIVRLDIEVLPSGTRFEAGEKLLLVVQGTDVNRYPKPAVYARHEDTVNNGPHILHTGGRFGSRLVIPVLPAAG
jgi:predicted acyl esterase